MDQPNFRVSGGSVGALRRLTPNQDNEKDDDDII